MIKKLLCAVALMFAAAAVFAQSAEKLELITNTEQLTIGQACYLAGCSSGAVEEEDSFEQAFAVYQDRKLFADKTADSIIRMDEFAALALSESGAKGDLWYRATGSKHYALRSLKQMNLVPKTTLAHSSISGREALRIMAQLIK